MMVKKVGIRREDKYLMERRCAVTPALVKKLSTAHPEVQFEVEKSSKRIFGGEAYEAAGAKIVDSAAHCDVVFGVKEMPEDYFEHAGTYVFFAHVIKGQPYNMPMLKAMMKKSCQLIDYEKIEDDKGRRLIFFGRYAGLAGMINSLWSLGQRLKEMGHPNCFEKVQQACTYNSLNEAMADVKEVGKAIRQTGLPDFLCPLVTGFTGYGNVSGGAQELYDLLPVREITPDELLKGKTTEDNNKNCVFKVVFKEKDLVKPLKSGSAFDLQDYYSNPQKYINDFEKYVPQLTMLMNCMYWDASYPRILTKSYLKKLFETYSTPKLIVIGDITCDPDGSIEATHQPTTIEEPVFVYDPITAAPHTGFKGSGVLIMAVDILPSELPKESSESFSQALENFVVPIATADYSKNFDDIKLPESIKKALILHKGQLTPNYSYIKKYLNPHL